MTGTANSAANACLICGADRPDRHERYCSPACRKRAKNRQKRDRKKFIRDAKRTLAIEDVAAKMGISLEEAVRRAEHDIAAGRLLAWRHRDGHLAEISTPRVAAPAESRGTV